MNRRLARCLPLLLALSPALLPLWQILHYGVDIPGWDQFDDDLAGLHIKAHAGAVTPTDLLAQHNEHRIALPRLCYLFLGRLTSGNAVAEMLAGWGLALATSLLLLGLLRRTRPNPVTEDRTQPRPGILWFLLNLLVFSPAQAENWLWGMGLANLMPMFWTTAAILVATTRLAPGVKLGLVAAGCTAATLSSGNGMLAWGLAGTVLLGTPGPRPTRVRTALLLAGAAALVAAAYFWNLAPPHHRGGTPYGAPLFEKINYTFAFLGSPFARAADAPRAATATATGLLSCALIMACLLRCRRPEHGERLQRALPWLAIAGFAVGSAALAAHARAQLGTTQAISSRYVSFALYLPAALVVLVPLLEPWKLVPSRLRPGPARAVTIGGTVLVLLSCAIVPSALRLSGETETNRRRVRAVAAFAPVLPGHPAIAALVFPDTEVAERNLRGLDAIGYLRPRLIHSDDASVRAVALPAGTEVGRLEQARQIGPDEVALAGWAALPPEAGRVDLVAICATDAHGSPRIVNIAPIDTPRPDKRAALGPAAAACGWGLHAPLSDLLHGRSQATLTAWAYDGERGALYPLTGTATLRR